jgi:hypothetical protein
VASPRSATNRGVLRMICFMVVPELIWNENSDVAILQGLLSFLNHRLCDIYLAKNHPHTGENKARAD